MPSPHEDELRLLASPVPAHTTSGVFCHSATAPMDWTGCLSNTADQVVPRFVVLNRPPVPVAAKNVAGRFSTVAKSEMRPPMLAGPIERQLRSRNSPGSRASAGSFLGAGAAFTKRDASAPARTPGTRPGLSVRSQRGGSRGAGGLIARSPDGRGIRAALTIARAWRRDADGAPVSPRKPRSIGPARTPDGAPAPARARDALLHVEQLDLEDERGVGRNRTLAARPIAQIGRDREPALAVHAHALNALVPAADDLALAQDELELRPARDGSCSCSGSFSDGGQCVLDHLTMISLFMSLRITMTRMTMMSRPMMTPVPSPPLGSPRLAVASVWRSRSSSEARRSRTCSGATP